MKRFLLLLIASTPLFGHDYYADPVCECMCPCGKSEFYAQLLYVRPTIDDLGFAVLDDQPGCPRLPVGELVTLCPDYHLGFRIGAMYTFPNLCEALELNYGRIKQPTKSIIEDQSFWLTMGAPLFVSKRLSPPAAFCESRLLLQTEVANIIYRRSFDCGGKCSFYPLAALHYLSLDVQQVVQYQGTDCEEQFQFHEVRQKCESWALGARFGGGVKCALPCSFCFVGELGFGLGRGDTTNNEHQIDIVGETEESLDLADIVHGITVPNFFGRLGITYSQLICGRTRLTGELHYEYAAYYGASTYIRFLDKGGTNQEICRKFTLNGLNAGFRVAF